MKTPKPKRERIPQSEVFAWVEANYPELAVEAERAWVWIATPPLPEPAEKALSAYGFIRSKKGGHLLPSGRLGLYGHSCEKPMPFKRKFFKGKPADGKPAQPEHEPEPEKENIDEEALAFLAA